ncbi:MAG: tripartite tricarboxylate transporter substrate binding protein [Betaproteobacteria bacterium]|nr:tripartite tricarboxylate transporter substrate binding protein [Betaproteobacteria bacterium]
MRTIDYSSISGSLITALAAALSLATAPASAQSYPSKAIKLIVPYEAGGGADNVARGAAQRMADGLGGTIVIENRPGAGTILAAELVAKAAPDSYTLFLTTGTAVSINQHMFKKLPYNPEKDFVAVGMIGASPYGMFAHSSVPANTFKDLLAYAKANPGKLNVALGGAGTPTHFALQMLELASDTRFTAVQYKGNASSLADTLGGRTELIMGVPPLMLPHVKSGKLKALAITSPVRFPQLPDVPAIAEFFPGFEAQTWYGVMAPTGTARDIIDRHNAEIQKYTKDPAIRDKWLAQGTVMQGGTPEQLTGYIKSETERWGVLMKRLGLTLE